MSIVSGYTELGWHSLCKRRNRIEKSCWDKASHHMLTLLLVTSAVLWAHFPLTSGAILIPLFAFLSRGLHHYSVSGVTSEAGKDKVWVRNLTQPRELACGTTPHTIHHHLLKVLWDLRQPGERRGQSTCSQMHQKIPEATIGKWLSQSRSSMLLAFLFYLQSFLLQIVKYVLMWKK